MYDHLKELGAGDKFSVDHPAARTLTSQDDYEVRNVRLYTQEEGELLVLELEDHILIAHTLCGDPRYYVYEECVHGSIGDLDEEGVSPLDTGNEFRQRMKVRVGGKVVAAKAVCGPVYEMVVERNDTSGEDPFEVACCEFRTNSKQHPFLLVVRQDDRLEVYQGVRVPEDALVL